MKLSKHDRVEWQYAGVYYQQKATVEHVRKDGKLVLHFDGDAPGSLLVVYPTDVRRLSPKNRKDPARRASFPRIRRAGYVSKRTGGLRTRTFTNVLGEKRTVRLYAMGNFACPFCQAGVRGPYCTNPGCSAGRYKTSSGWKFMQTRVSILKGRADSKAAADHEARRTRDHAWSMKRAEDSRREHADAARRLVAQAQAKGACVACLNTSSYGPVKFVKHRGPCPKSKRR